VSHSCVSLVRPRLPFGHRAEWWQCWHAPTTPAHLGDDRPRGQARWWPPWPQVGAQSAPVAQGAVLSRCYDAPEARSAPLEPTPCPPALIERCRGYFQRSSYTPRGIPTVALRNPLPRLRGRLRGGCPQHTQPVLVKSKSCLCSNIAAT
jgi:hypothetical protein